MEHGGAEELFPLSQNLRPGRAGVRRRGVVKRRHPWEQIIGGLLLGRYLRQASPEQRSVGSRERPLGCTNSLHFFRRGAEAGSANLSAAFVDFKIKIPKTKEAILNSWRSRAEQRERGLLKMESWRVAEEGKYIGGKSAGCWSLNLKVLVIRLIIKSLPSFEIYATLTLYSIL